MTRPIRVLELINGYAVEGPLGGAERFVIEMTSGLDKSVVQPQVFGLWDWGSPHQEKWRQVLLAAGIPAHEGPVKDDRAPYQNFMAALRAIRQAASGPMDIIHSHSEFGDVAALLLKGPLRARAAIRTVHLGREWSKRPLRRLGLTQFLYPLKFDAELGVSQRMVVGLDARPLARLLGRRATVMYNALNFARFEGAVALRADAAARAAKRQTLDLPADAVVIGAVGRLVALKGFNYLLEAAQIVVAQHPRTHFIVAGYGDQAEQLQQMATGLGIADRVHFLGARMDIEALYAVMDLYVSSSLWEGLPTTILEAMAVGVPVVATRVSGTLELVRDQQTGFLVEPGAPAALAATIMAALSSPHQANMMTVRAGAFVRAHFDLGNIARQHQAFYTHLVENSR